MTTSPTSEGSEPPRTVSEAAAVAMHTDPRFRELRTRLVRFVLPASVAFLAWYLLYVLLSAYADGFMSTKVVGRANIALFFGLLQFVTTFGIAVLYSRYANRRLDPLADELRAELEGSRPEPAAPRGEDA